MNRSRSFSRVEIRYLRSLPAVAGVTSTRITYSDAFRASATARYLAGESPVKIFREAGLDPRIIGYKRIERAFARWKTQSHPTPKDGEDAFDFRQPAATPARHSDEPDEYDGNGGDDLRDRLIAEQALRIAWLQERVKELEQELEVGQALPQA